MRTPITSPTLRSSPSVPMPRQAIPALSVPTLDRGPFTLGEDAAPNFTFDVRCRGLPCPVGLKYLLEPGRLQAGFDQRGVKVILVSGDGRDRTGPARGEHAGPV